MTDVQFSRRVVLAGASAAILGHSAGNAAMTCGAVNQWNGVQACEVGLPVWDIEAKAASTTQEQQNWCWAACISGVFAWHGHSVSQSRIVEKIYGSQVDKAATGEQIFDAVNGQWYDDEDEAFTGQASPLIDSNFSFANPDAAAAMSIELRDNFPLIVGTQGHATIVTAMSWVNTPAGQQITNVVVRDPWPGNPKRRSLSAAEFAQINLLMQVRAS